ncbi:flagellin [Meinhardsimonia xiamenensis]|uniref:Flagellin n=1 Tax=Meinhardsimonia xiamenensis TaxID=990712 RepID=A0A1G9EMJ9_9RHOB|nr:flagellin [Meinhardsimonia xiamenensis]PRX33708.1 flagellin [Meinhardsimonia xiamenensis]SDK77271.1 flagellin [Meinhardsimonia xiamenensis]
MSSILTNTSAMVALQTLKSINADLSKTQNEISTGKAVATAKDNASVWAISKVMEADVKGFQAISESLSLGQSTVAVAREATETITDLLTQIKGKIVAAQEDNVDRGKIQTDIAALRDQINSVVNAAQFNGLNLLQGTEDVNVLASLDRASDGTVTASSITVQRHDLTTSAGTYGSGTSLSANATVSAATVANTANTVTLTVDADADVSADSFQVTIGGSTVSFAAGDITGDQDAAATAISAAINALGLEGITASVSGADVTISSTRAFEAVSVSALKNGAGAGMTLSASEIAERAENVTFSNSANVNEGDGYRVTIGSSAYTYVAGKNETFEDVARGLKAAIDAAGLDGITTQVSRDNNGAWQLKVDNDGASLAFAVTGAAGGQASGGLFGLGGIDVTSSSGAAAALSNIETLIDKAIDASAAFGSYQGRIETQASFVGKLTDSLKAGIGSLVDADMEEASARLQALQVQQQLGIQSLSIANQAPQSILSLFR